MKRLFSGSARPFDGFKLHLLLEGLIAVCVALLHLLMLRGIEWRALLLFGLPPLMAFLFLHSNQIGARRLALGFLLLIAVGACFAPFPGVLPKLGGVDRRLPQEADRLLAWYGAVYLLFALGVVPTWGLISNLRSSRTGMPAMISRFTCYLGLIVIVFMWPGMVVVLAKYLGLWPIV